MTKIIRQTTLAIGVFLLLLNFTFAQEALPKGAKLKTIEYKTTDYVAIGYVEKDLFVENQIITFLTKETQDTIVSGKYYTKEGIAYINGIWKHNTENGITRAKGIFKIANNDGVGLTLKSKEGKNLSISVDDIFYYQGFTNKNPATLEKQKNGNIQCVILYLNRENLSKLEFFVSKTLIDKYGFFAIDDFVFYTTEVKMIYKNGSVFTGNVENTKDADNDINFKMKEGKWKTANGEEEELIMMPNSDYKYRSVYLKEKDKNNIVEVELIITPSQIEKWGFWATNEYFNNISQVKYTYKNGNIYVGKIDLEKKQLTNGTYQYFTGEVFEGNLGGEWYFNIPLEGKMKFANGAIEDGDWLEKYDWAKSEYGQIEKTNSPTEIRKIAIEYFYERQYQAAVKKAISELENNNYDKAKEYYLKAKTFKPNQSKFIDDEIAKIDETIKDQEWKNEMITKYGETFGLSIYNGEFVVGMTKQMADEIMAEEIFTINTTSIVGNQTMETWAFNQDNLTTKLAELQRRWEGFCKKFGEKSEECRLAAKRSIHLATTLQKYAERIQLFGGPKMPRRLYFTNGKLTDIYR